MADRRPRRALRAWNRGPRVLPPGRAAHPSGAGMLADFPLVFLETELLWPKGETSILLNVNTLSGDDAAVRKEMTAEEELIYTRVCERTGQSSGTLKQDLLKPVPQQLRE